MREEPLVSLLGDLARTMLDDRPIQVMLDDLVRRIGQMLAATGTAATGTAVTGTAVTGTAVTGVGITLMSPGMFRQYVAAWGPGALADESWQTTLGQGPGLTAFASGAAVLVPDLADDDRYASLRQAMAPTGPAALFSFPLLHAGTQLGALTLYRDEPGPLAPSVQGSAQLIAEVGAAYLVNAQARRQAVLTASWYRDRSVRDALTGLPNRVLLRERLQHASARSQRTHTAVAVLFVDLDSFKSINDTYGHRLGDDLLIAVSGRLSALVRPGDTLARVSGDEFVFLCEELEHASDVESLVARIDAAFAEPFVLASLELAVTASVGIAYSGPGEAVTEDLLLEADTAMFQAKRQGGATHQVIDLPLAEEALDLRNLERDLHEALTRSEIAVAYQPIVRARDGLVTGVEALLRWTHPDRGPVSAAMAVAIAEGSGLITEIGTWVLERSCRDWVQWRSERPDRSLDLSVNVSARQLMAPGFDATVATVLYETGMDPGSLVLEVTEGIFVDDGDRALSVLSELRRIGTRVALDDFGTGYSSLSYLRRFPVDIVKIDQSFVADLGHHPDALTMVAAVTHLAHDLGKTVTAEGVETESQRDEVVRVGCERAQGYYFARPMAAAEFSARFN